MINIKPASVILLTDKKSREEIKLVILNTVSLNEFK